MERRQKGGDSDWTRCSHSSGKPLPDHDCFHFESSGLRASAGVCPIRRRDSRVGDDVSACHARTEALSGRGELQCTKPQRQAVAPTQRAGAFESNNGLDGPCAQRALRYAAPGSWQQLCSPPSIPAAPCSPCAAFPPPPTSFVFIPRRRRLRIFLGLLLSFLCIYSALTRLTRCTYTIHFPVQPQDVRSLRGWYPFDGRRLRYSPQWAQLPPVKTVYRE